MYAHLANARYQIKRLSDSLDVIIVVFNPLRFISRYNLFTAFKKHAEDSGARVWVVELAFGERPFECTDSSLPRNIQFRTYHEIWHKEVLVNEAVARLSPDWKYVAWIDADVTFLNPDWVHETLQQLQHYQMVQLFTHAVDLGPNGEPIDNFQSFASSLVQGKLENLPKFGGVERPRGSYYLGAQGRYWHPGYGWAYRREAWDMLGGLLDVNIVGGGDHQMAYGLAGKIADTIPTESTASYAQIIRNWQRNALRLRRNIGAVPATVIHHWHGRKVERGYYDRWRILTDNRFDPILDLRKDWQRMYMLAGNKVKLRDDLRAYFRARNEDGVEV